MVFRDLRDWVSFLEKKGELVHLEKEIYPDQAGPMGRAICDVEGPAVLAEKVAGFNTRMAIGLHGSWRRSNLAIGLPPNAPHQEHVEKWAAALDTFAKKPIKAKMVDDAPCKENIVTGDKVNIFQFPIARVNDNDASFYISKSMCITRDPEIGWVNMGMHRMMLQKRNQTGILFNNHQDIGIHFAKYLARGQSMPMAVALGAEPVLPMAAGAKMPFGWSEFDIVSTLRGEPEELTMAETVDLPVPARAEIILEGEVKRDVRTLEGPFAEFPGGYSFYHKTPVFEIKTITYRNDPIYDFLYIGRSYTDAEYMTCRSKLGGMLHAVKSRYPQVTQISMLPSYWLNTVVQGRWVHPGEPRHVMFCLWDHGIAAKMITCVDEDVDPWNPADVMWAISTRTQADRDLVIVPDCVPILDPSTNLHGGSCRLGIDATKSRYPYYRSKPVGWVYPPKGTGDWKQELAKLKPGKE